jgi:hypothetical protein
MMESKSEQMKKATKAAFDNNKATADVKQIAEEYYKRMLARLEALEAGGRPLTPEEKKEREQIYEDMKTIQRALTGEPAKTVLERLHDQLHQSMQPRSLMKNAVLLGVCCAIAPLAPLGIGLLGGALGATAALAFLANPFGLAGVLGVLVAGAILFAAVKLVSGLAKWLWNAATDSPGARMDAAKKQLMDMQPASATPSANAGTTVVVTQGNAGSQPNNKPAPGSHGPRNW